MDRCKKLLQQLKDEQTLSKAWLEVCIFFLDDIIRHVLTDWRFSISFIRGSMTNEKYDLAPF